MPALMKFYGKLAILVIVFASPIAQAQISLPAELSNWQLLALRCEVWQLPVDVSLDPTSLGKGEISFNLQGDPLIQLSVLAHPKESITIGQRHTLGRQNSSKYDNCFWNLQYVESRQQYLFAYQCHRGAAFRVTSPYSSVWINPLSVSATHKICKIAGSAGGAAYTSSPCLELRNCK